MNDDDWPWRTSQRSPLAAQNAHLKSQAREDISKESTHRQPWVSEDIPKESTHPPFLRCINFLGLSHSFCTFCASVHPMSVSKSVALPPGLAILPH